MNQSFQGLAEGAHAPVPFQRNRRFLRFNYEPDTLGEWDGAWHGGIRPV
jgi:hypothetical protein